MPKEDILVFSQGDQITCMENLEMSGNLTAVSEMGFYYKSGKCQGKNLVKEKWPKTAYC